MKKQNKSLLSSFGEFKKINQEDMSNVQGGIDLHPTNKVTYPPTGPGCDNEVWQDVGLLGGMLDLKIQKII